jgi:crotonobetainyl-CoA:carnitine CoA-transferase CaiB-like acyl-CoA transferase
MLLAGRTVLEWTQDISGSFCARVLGDLGAEVIKIESPRGGDLMRSMGPVQKEGVYGQTPLFGYLNHGKRSFTLDPATPSGARIFLDLAKQADFLIETEISRGVAHDMVSIDALRAASEKLVIVSITPFGIAGGPPSSPMTLQHRAGYAFHEAAPVTDPAGQPPVGCTDREGPLAIGVAAAVSAMYGLLSLKAGTPATHIDLAQFDFYATQLYPGPLGEWSEGRRTFDRNRSNFGGTEVAGGLVWILECSDGWIIVSPREQHQWDRWMKVLGNPGWSVDAPLCGDRAIRKANFMQLQELMSGETRRMTRDAIFEASRQGHVACLPVNYPSDLLKTEQLVAREFFDHLASSDQQTITIPGLPFRLRSGNDELKRGRQVRAPELGEANWDMLTGKLGLDAGDIQQLINSRVV